MAGVKNARKSGLMPWKPSRRPATASARIDENLFVSSSQAFHFSNNGNMASTSIGNAQLCDHMNQMGIPFHGSGMKKEKKEQEKGSMERVNNNKQDSFGSHRRSVSFLDLIDRTSRGPSHSLDSTLEDVSKVKVSDCTFKERRIFEREARETAGEGFILCAQTKEGIGGEDSGTHLVLSKAFARIAELESSLEYYERSCVDATFESDFWQKEYNRLYDVMRVAEQKQEQMMSYIHTLESRLKLEGKYLDQHEAKEVKGKTKVGNRSSTSIATVAVPTVQPVKGDINSHSMLEIASSTTSSATIDESSNLLIPIASHLTAMKELKRVTSSSTMKTKEIFGFDRSITASSTSTTTQKIHQSYNPLIAPILQNHINYRESNHWDQEKRKVISKWVESAQISNEENQKNKRLTTMERSLKEASKIQNVNELFYKGWTIDVSPQREEEEQDKENQTTISSNREEDVRDRHPFSITGNDPALKARWANIGTPLGLDHEQDQAQAYAGLQAHSRWRVWKVNMGK